MNRITMPDFSSRFRERAKLLLQYTRDKLVSSDLSASSVLTELFTQFKQLFTHLKKPEFTGWTIRQDDRRDLDKFKEEISKIQRDVQVGMTESLNLIQASGATFNYTKTLSDAVTRKSNKVTSTSLDVQLLNEEFQRDVFVIGDSFVDDTMLDPGFPREGAAADMPAGKRHFTLHRSGVESKLTGRGRSADITIVNSLSPMTYEGRLYALFGEAEPAGQFQFMRKSISELFKLGLALIEPIAKAFGVWTSFMEKFNKIFGGTDPAAAAEAKQAATSSTPTAQKPINFAGFGEVSNDDKVMVLMNPTKKDLKEIRFKMLDHNPDTFWQIESVAPISQSAQGDTDPLNPVTPAPTSKSSMPKNNLDVRITVDLGKVTGINVVTLSPYNAEMGGWLEVINLETSEDGVRFYQIPNFSDHRYENKLTKEANAELSEYESEVLGPNRFDYSGFGLWAFEPRDTRYVRFTLRQSVCNIISYNILRLHMSRTITTYYKIKEEHLFGSTDRSTGYIFENEYAFKDLSYIDSLSMDAGNAREESYVKKEDGTIVAYYSKDTDNPFGWVSQFMPVGGWFKEKKEVTVLTGAGEWTIDEVEVLLRTDRERMCIGIRDIDALASTFETSSSLVSKRFSVPNPIRKLSLVADEMIPKNFEGSGTYPWINYYISFDDITWHQIAPVSMLPIVDTSGKVLPQVMNINSLLSLSEQNPNEMYVNLTPDPTMIRLKAVLTRPTSDNYKWFSPVLKGYRLKLILDSGVS